MPPAAVFHRVARPDAIDFRDRPYRPMVSSAKRWLSPLN